MRTAGIDNRMGGGKVIEFSIAWTVQPKQSMRMRVVAGKGRKPFAMAYQSSAVRQNESQLITLMQPYKPDLPIVGPVRASFVFSFPWRTTDSKRQRAKLTAPKTTKPDLTQLVKQIEDCLERGGFLTNDAQIAEYATVRKQFADAPGVYVRLEEIV